jgi:predicted nucleic acid-binding protein
VFSRVVLVEQQYHSASRFPTRAAYSHRAFLDDLKATVAIYPITADTAELVGKINAESSQQGITIPFDDLLIGACALERGYAIATRNQRHFQKIPGLTLMSV